MNPKMNLKDPWISSLIIPIILAVIGAILQVFTPIGLTLILSILIAFVIEINYIRAQNVKLSFAFGFIILILVAGFTGAAVTNQRIVFATETTSNSTGVIVETALTDTGMQEKLETYNNSIGMEFVRIPAGKFVMGSSLYDNNGPVHQVTIEKSYYLGKYEVTQRQWIAVMGSNPSSFIGDDLPVDSVSWNDVQEFIKKLNEKDGTDKYCLPSEAEWEYACRAGTVSRYYFGDTSKPEDYMWNSNNSGNKPNFVGQKKQNPWGLYDMYGNVGEWVQDNYHSSYDGAPSDGSAWCDNSSNSSFHIIRSGTWSVNPVMCSSTMRAWCSSSKADCDVGFRLMRNI